MITVGLYVGEVEGPKLGLRLGSIVVGLIVGDEVGGIEGDVVTVGLNDGEFEGRGVGLSLGTVSFRWHKAHVAPGLFLSSCQHSIFEGQKYPKL